MSKFKRYLGDSVYADFDGYHVVLTTENGLPEDPSNRICLEPHLIELIQKYYEGVRSELSDSFNQPVVEGEE